MAEIIHVFMDKEYDWDNEDYLANFMGGDYWPYPSIKSNDKQAVPYNPLKAYRYLFRRINDIILKSEQIECVIRYAPVSNGKHFLSLF